MFGVIAAPLLLAGTGQVAAERLYICSGYGCIYKKSMVISPAAKRQLARIMARGKTSAASERLAVGKAVSYYESLATRAIGVRDGAISSAGGARVYGQMDCIDESRNTRSLLLYLERSGMLRHHKVGRNSSRGFFVDVRYPHATAVLRSSDDGERWAVDSWFEPAGGEPDIMKLSEWKMRGVRGER
ncbi:hypothetical protein AB2N04_10710 [Nitratireductor sp. GISD-1A_MAKvit]|uniref:hypothetical protein n=1 Tax=Nitratireductor sp. GISD-1A_MAKvit TaxID=3234198 RepID=UPI0034677C39